MATRLSFWVLLALTLLPPRSALAQDVEGPSFKDVLSLREVESPAIAPDGEAIVFEVEKTNWDDNRTDTELWISRRGHRPVPLTRTPDASNHSPRWSPDGKHVAFLSERDDATQLYALRADGGEARPLTNADEGINSFRWSPSGSAIAYTRQDPTPDSIETRTEKYGDFQFDDRSYQMTHLYTIEVDSVLSPLPWTSSCAGDSLEADCTPLPEPKQLTDGDTLTVSDFEWGPDGKRIVLTHQEDPLINSWMTADIAVLDVDTKAFTPLVSRVGYDGGAEWSPDGNWIFFETDQGNTTSNYYENEHYATISSSGGTPTPLAEGFDENLSAVHWTPQGLYALAWQKTERHLVRIDPESGTVSPVATRPRNVWSIDFSANGSDVALLGQTPTTLPEVYRTSMDAFEPVRVTRASSQIADWSLGSREVISWTSRDGTPIEGVLHMPPDFDPSEKYPLLVNIHGGPTGIDYPSPIDAYVYPIAQWLAKGAIVLQPNYRGSAGYGEEFRSLNVRNLGVGDKWDVMSGVDHLIDRGIVDTTRMGAMGWSQGGYISAFLTTHTDRFDAISVGAGISDWATYYVNTDIHPFTRQYLDATPWDDPAIYQKTSPITTIQQASTPTLIQHGENDRRVPIPNAYKLLQGLRDQNVPTELVVYQGFGHGITKPKERLAAMWHNWQWFGKYLWKEDIDLPVDPSDGAESEKDNLDE